MGQTGFFNLGVATGLGEEKFRIYTSCIPLKVNRVAPSHQHLGVVAIEKGAFGSPLH